MRGVWSNPRFTNLYNIRRTRHRRTSFFAIFGALRLSKTATRDELERPRFKTMDPLIIATDLNHSLL